MKKDVEIVGFQMLKVRKEQLKKIADRKGISLSALLNLIVSEYLDSSKKK